MGAYTEPYGGYKNNSGNDSEIFLPLRLGVPGTAVTQLSRWKIVFFSLGNHRLCMVQYGDCPTEETFADEKVPEALSLLFVGFRQLTPVIKCFTSSCG